MSEVCTILYILLVCMQQSRSLDDEMVAEGEKKDVINQFLDNEPHRLEDKRRECVRSAENIARSGCYPRNGHDTEGRRDGRPALSALFSKMGVLESMTTDRDEQKEMRLEMITMCALAHMRDDAWTEGMFYGRMKMCWGSQEDSTRSTRRSTLHNFLLFSFVRCDDTLSLSSTDIRTATFHASCPNFRCFCLAPNVCYSK